MAAGIWAYGAIDGHRRARSRALAAERPDPRWTLLGLPFVPPGGREWLVPVLSLRY